MNLLEHAKLEFEILGWPGECEMQQLACENILELLKVFSEQGHSGSSAPYILNHFQMLAKFDPISPLTGRDEEWAEVSDGVFQNKRSSDVFKNGRNGRAYWIHGKIFKDKNGGTYTSKDSRVYIDFPWVKPRPEIVEVE